MSSYQKIGRLGKTHGYKGAIKITLEPEAIPFFESQKVFFLDIKGEYIPYFYKIASEFLNETCIVELEEVVSKEEAQKLSGKEVFIQSKKPIIKTEKDQNIIGFKVEDKELGEVGVIDELIEMTHHSLIQLEYKGKSVLIPLHPDFILDVNKSKKILYLDLPSGILEI